MQFKPLRGDRRPPTDGQGELGARAREGQQADRTLGKVWTNLEQNQDATNDRNDAENHRKSSQNSSREGPGIVPNRSRHPPRAPSSEEKPHGAPKLAKKSRKSAESRSKMASLGPKWDPKIDKKTTRSEKSVPKMAPEAVFIDFLDRRRSESLPRPVLGRSEP